METFICYLIGCIIGQIIGIFFLDWGMETAVTSLIFALIVFGLFKIVFTGSLF